MVSECANPACRAPFLYMREGRLVAVERKSDQAGAHVEYFWLCGDCAEFWEASLPMNEDCYLLPRPRLEHCREDA